MDAVATARVPYRVAAMRGCGRYRSRTVPRGRDAWMRSLPRPYRTEWPPLDAVATAPVLYRVAAMLECGRYRSRTVPRGRDA